MPIVGVCGDNCSECPRFAATRSGERSQLAVVAELWFRAGLRDTLPLPEEMACHGCNPAKRCAYADQRQCALQRNFSNCGECREYPCQIVSCCLARSDALAERCQRSCRPEEWEVLRKAFFSKRENLKSVAPGKREDS